MPPPDRPPGESGVVAAFPVAARSSGARRSRVDERDAPPPPCCTEASSPSRDHAGDRNSWDARRHRADAPFAMSTSLNCRPPRHWTAAAERRPAPVGPTHAGAAVTARATSTASPEEDVVPQRAVPAARTVHQEPPRRHEARFVVRSAFHGKSVAARAFRCGRGVGDVSGPRQQRAAGRGPPPRWSIRSSSARQPPRRGGGRAAHTTATSFLTARRRGRRPPY